jgi:hypothetical protein
MKISLRYIVPLLGIATTLPYAAAQPADESLPKQKREMRVLVGSGPDGETPSMPREHRRMIFHGDAASMETVAFLGVESVPVNPALAAQLNLARGTGLVVGHVVPQSPAAAVLKVHDVLVKLDDQVLIEPRQFAVLVRNHKEGDEVSLTYMRGGKEATAKVKLTKREVPKMVMLEGEPPEFGFAARGAEGESPTAGRADVDRMLWLMDGGAAPGRRHMQINRGGGPGDRTVSVTVNTGDSKMVFKDDKGALELKIDDGKKNLVAKNSKGEEIFSGPVNTAEERKAVPPDVLERLVKIESMHDFSFKTDEDFKAGDVKVVRPPGSKIRLVLPTQPAHRAPSATPAF